MRYFAFKLLALAILSFSAPLSAVSEELYFPSTDRDWDTVTPESLGWDVAALEHVIELVGKSNGKSFLILKDGKIVAERYWTPAGADHTQYVMSCGKSITAFLIGIAQEQGKLKIEHPVADFLGAGLSKASKVQEQSIHI